MKKYHSTDKLKNRKLNLVLGNTERGAVSNEAVFVKYYPDFKLSLGNLERKLKLLIFQTDTDCNNSGRLKSRVTRSRTEFCAEKVTDEMANFIPAQDSL